MDQNIRSDILNLRHQLFLNKHIELEQLVKKQLNNRLAKKPIEIKKIPSKPTVFYNRIVNLTDVHFETKEIDLLNKALKYAPESKPKPTHFSR